MENIYLWANGTWCYSYELEEMLHMSDDFQIIYEGTPEHDKFLEQYE